MHVNVITNAGNSRCLSRVVSGTCDCVRVCVCVRAVKKNDLSCQHQIWRTYTLWQDIGMHLTLRSNDHNSRSQDYEVCCGRVYACRYDCFVLVSVCKRTGKRFWCTCFCEILIFYVRTPWSTTNFFMNLIFCYFTVSELVLLFVRHEADAIKRQSTFDKSTANQSLKSSRCLG